METTTIVHDASGYHKLEAFLAQQLYEFNALVTGCSDAAYLAATIQNANGEIIAGAAGHTWHRTCFLGHVWVAETQRSTGIGTRLLNAVEIEAKQRGCENVILSTHSFQAPLFYEKLGYRKQADVHDHPVGHKNIWFSKRL